MTSAAADGPDLPGTSTSPFDPSPDPALNPFISTIPFEGSHESWQGLASSDEGRERALKIGQAHGELMRSIEDLSRKNGGGLMGAARGLLLRLEEQHVIAYGDRERLMALLTHLRDSLGQTADQDAAFSRLQELHQAIVREPTSSPLALATSAVAVDSVTRALTSDSPTYREGFHDGGVTALADVYGAIAGGFGGPLTSLATSVAASTIALHTHVDVSYS